MPAWITLTTADLDDIRVAELVTALRTEALGVGQTDPAPRLLQTTVDEVRRCIAFCASTPLDSDPATIPAGLKDLVVQKVARTMKGRLLMPLSDDEREAEKLYQKRLEQLTRCEWPVDTPDNALSTPPVNPAGGVEQIGGDSRRFTRATLAGL